MNLFKDLININQKFEYENRNLKNDFENLNEKFNEKLSSKNN